MTIGMLDAAYALLVAGAALVWPPLSLIVAGLFLVATWAVNDRRTTAEAKPK